MPIAKGRHGARAASELLIATLLLAWPALYNGFPILYPDSMTYLDDGRIVARALFLRHFSEYYGMRSFIYSLGILPFHWNLTAWPIVALQCFLVAYVLRLVVRSLAPGFMTPRLASAVFLTLILLLSAFTSVSWFSCLVLPDILGSLVYLAFFLVAFAPATLTRLERYSLYLIAWWGIASHASHLILAGALCVVIAAILSVQRQSLRRTFRTTTEVAAIVAIAAGSQLALNAYLYGHPSLNGERPPFLMARVIADGPGRWYLEKHCGELNWTICKHVRSLNTDPDIFLWSPDGTWESASDDEQQQMLDEEIPLVIATLRTYPQAQISRSAGNFWEQLKTFGFNDLDPSSWVLDQFATVMPAARASYLRSRQANRNLPLDDMTTFQFWIVIGSLGMHAVFALLLGRAISARLAALTLITAFVVVANAAVTGILSMPEDRFECRVIWMTPFLSLLFAMAWVDKRVGARRGKAVSARATTAQ
jgi:hypothetical protein